MTLHTHCRGPIRVVDAPDGHDVTIEGRLDVHSVPDVRDVIHVQINAPDRPIFQAMLFSKIVPNCKKLGLLDAADGWLRDRFTELGVIQFEDWVDTGEEYAMLDEVAKDRAAGAAAY